MEPGKACDVHVIMAAFTSSAQSVVKHSLQGDKAIGFSHCWREA
jgi:hypothetical protein